ncbi:alpha/beta fold hydrolase [Streptomyces sp. NPDC049627]|uniref:alpha/beta fold hydrolase n=1 Tax=Streptomyces sp. NPDC049627 TaxID=3365595 RepID=UPI0037BB9E6C
MGATGLGVVLVHGFNSSSEMWEPLCRLIGSDEGLAFVGTLPFAYSTSLWTLDARRRIPGFDTIADSLKEFLDTEARPFSRLVLVSHSQGGLVVQRHLARMTAEGRGNDLARIDRVVMLACPNNGSEIALSLRRRLVRNNPQERELRPLDEQVADTQRAVLRDIVNAREVTPHTCPIPFSVYAGETDNIVTPASARGTFPDAAVLPGDHFGIARPDSHTHRTYTTLRRLLRLPPPSRTKPADSTSPADPTAGEDAARSDSYIFPDTFAVVAVAERIPDMEDPAFRRTIVSQMRRTLSPGSGFSAAYKEHPRDHLVEIVERCRSHRDARGALAAFRDAITALRPDEAATTELRELIGAHR